MHATTADLWSSDGTIDCEPGIRPVCSALNSLCGVHTLWSCEGHAIRSYRPYVVFVAEQRLAFRIHTAIECGHLSGFLKYCWATSANFRDDGTLQYTTELSDTRLRRWWFYPLMRGRVDAEIARLATLIHSMNWQPVPIPRG